MEYYLEIIKRILQNGERYYIGVPVESIDESSRIIDDLSMDSIQIMDFLVDIEEECHITFDFEKLDAEKILTVGGIVKMIRHIAERK